MFYSKVGLGISLLIKCIRNDSIIIRFSKEILYIAVICCLRNNPLVPCDSSHYQRCHQNLYDFFFYILTKSAHLISPLYETPCVTPNALKRFRSSLHLLRLWIS